LAQYRTNTPPDITYPYLLVRNRDFDKCHPRWNEQNSPYNICSTQEYPAVIYDDRAISCTMFLTFDGRGNALHGHYPLIYKHDPTVTDYLTEHKEGFEQFVDPERLVVVTGTNSTYLGRDALLESIITFFGTESVQLLVARQNPHQQVFTQLPTQIQKILGLLFVPRQLSKTNRNEYFIIENEELAETIKQKLRIKEKHL